VTPEPAEGVCLNTKKAPFPEPFPFTTLLGNPYFFFLAGAFFAAAFFLVAFFID
jgi:hypothetical protein